MADRTRTRRNTLERKCLPKSLKRLFAGSSRSIFKTLEQVKSIKSSGGGGRSGLGR